MTLKSLMNFGSFGGDAPAPLERYHSESNGYYEHGYSHGGHRGGGKGGGGGSSGAALSALTLLAFLFLINVMQQSLQENNATTTSTITLREVEQPVSLNSRGDAADNRQAIGTYLENRYLPVKTSSQNGGDGK